MKHKTEGIGVCVSSVRIVAQLRRIHNRMRIHRGNQYWDDVRSFLCATCLVFSWGTQFVLSLIQLLAYDTTSTAILIVFFSLSFFKIQTFDFLHEYREGLLRQHSQGCNSRTVLLLIDKKTRKGKSEKGPKFKYWTDDYCDAHHDRHIYQVA